MSVLNVADAVYLGNQQADRIYVGNQQVWPPPYRQVVLMSNPADYWPLDETSGTVARNLASTRNGAYQAGVTLAGDVGPDGPAAVFSGLAGGQVRTSNTIGSAIAHIGSWEIWFRTDQPQTGSGVPLVATSGANTGNSATNVFSTSLFASGSNRVARAAWWSGSGQLVTSPGLVDDGEWHHLVAINGGTGERRQLYIDSVLVHDQPGINPTGGTANNFVMIGESLIPAWGGGTGALTRFAGSLAHVARYTNVLTVQQIADHFAAANI